MEKMSALQLSSSAIESERRSAGYNPSVWEDHFLTYSSQTMMEFVEKEEQQIKELTEEVKRILAIAASSDKPSELLFIIDDIQHLGIGYHFEKEINEAFKRIYSSTCKSLDSASCTDDDLHTTAVMFRLLRQNGYKVPCSVFDKFRGPDGNFDESLKTDAIGLLSLYEATHLQVHGEDILEEALSFTVEHLASMKENLSPPLRYKISRALNRYTIRIGFTRLEAWKFIKLYGEEASHSEVLLNLAKLDFNLLQKLHQRELGNLTRWWSSLDVKKNFPFVRDRLAEDYYFSLVAYQPERATFRTIYTKVLGVITIIDDIFDVHGTLDELELFAGAVERWDMEVIDELPEYMQVCYIALLDVYSEIVHFLPEEARSYGAYFGIESMKGMVRAYIAEARWCHQGYTPTMEEYMNVAQMSGGAIFLFVTAFLGMPDVPSKDVFEWVFSVPKMINACQIVIRLLSDIAGYKFEQKTGQVKAVECYMKQHGVTEEEAKHELRKRISDAWKDIYEEFLKPIKVIPAPPLAMAVEITRMMDFWHYEEIDIYTHSMTTMKDAIAALLVDPIPIDM